MPERFELKYRGSDGADHRPVMIHRALAGSMERFFGVLIEHFGGNFPAWLAPIQTVVAPISEHQLDYAHEVGATAARGRTCACEVDESNEKLGYKIRHWKTQKVPFILVVGKAEAAEGTVNVNERGNDVKRTIPIDAFAAELREIVDARR